MDVLPVLKGNLIDITHGHDTKIRHGARKSHPPPDLERLGRYDEHRVRQRFRDGFDAAHTWVIEVGGEFAGCVALRPAEDAVWLEHFYLAPRLQGGGIGSGVLRELLERCDGEGTLVRLNVLRGSPARRLYERHGFVVESEDAVDVFMVRELDA